jgi:hypothetical protein
VLDWAAAREKKENGPRGAVAATVLARLKENGLQLGY